MIGIRNPRSTDQNADSGKCNWIPKFRHGVKREKPRAVTICLENPEIPGRIQMAQFIPVEIFRKKKQYSSKYYFFAVLTETTEIFCTICLDYWCLVSCREKVENLPAVFCKWYKSIPFLFSVQKKNTSTIWQKFFTEISV